MSLLPSAPPAPAPIRALGAAVDWSVVAIGATMVALVFANVVLHVFHRDNPWTTEFCEFLMVWVTFLGAAAATRRGLHMSINEFVDKLAMKGARSTDNWVIRARFRIHVDSAGVVKVFMIKTSADNCKG